MAGGFDPYTDEPGDILYGPSDQFGLTSWAASSQIVWRWFGNFTPEHVEQTRALQGIARKRLAQLQLRTRLGAESNLGMGKEVWQERTGEVITAITRPGHEEIWIESSPGAKIIEEEDETPYFPYLWIGARIKLGTTECTEFAAATQPEVRLWVWEPANSAPESARVRSQGPRGTRAGLSTQYVGCPYDGFGLGCNLGMGTKPGGDTSAFESPSLAGEAGSVPTMRAFSLGNCDDQEILLRKDDNSFGVPNFDGIYIPSCCLPIETFTVFFDQQCTRYLPGCFPQTVSGDIIGAMEDITGITEATLSTLDVRYTDSGLVHLEFPFAYNPEQDPDAPDPDSMWAQVVYLDPDDPVHKFETTLPFQFYGGQVTKRGIIGPSSSPTAPSWSIQGDVLPGKYVVKVAMTGYPCCNPFPLGRGGGGATIELEVRLGRAPGRTLKTRFEFPINGRTQTFRDALPYGWWGGFSLGDIREFDNVNEGPCNPLSHANWWPDALLVDVQTGSVDIEPNYWLDGATREEDVHFEVEHYPGFIDKPFDTASWISDFCDTCDFDCIDPPLDCDSGGPCSDFFFQAAATGSGTVLYPGHVIFHRAILICVEPPDSGCRVDVNPFTGEVDPFLGRNKPHQIQIVNNCSTPGPNQVGSCEPLGNGMIIQVAIDFENQSEFFFAHDFQLGDVMFVIGTNSSNVFITPEGDPEIASNLFLNANLICPGIPNDGIPVPTRDGGPHGQFLDSLGINETKCENGVEVVTQYLGQGVCGNKPCEI